jgi:hypothetical protein
MNEKGTKGPLINSCIPSLRAERSNLVTSESMSCFVTSFLEGEGSLMEDHDPGGESFDLLRPMRGKKYRLPQRMNLFQQKVYFLRHFEIKTRRRLIKEKQRWTGEEGASDADSLLQAFRQDLHFIITKRKEAEFLQRLFDPGKGN